MGFYFLMMNNCKLYGSRINSPFKRIKYRSEKLTAVLLVLSVIIYGELDCENALQAEDSDMAFTGVNRHDNKLAYFSVTGALNLISKNGVLYALSNEPSQMTT